MPRRRKPPRLYQRPDTGEWVIRDGAKSKRTGYGPEQYAEAQRALAEYLSTPPARRGPAHPHEITVGEILARYADDKGPSMSSPQTLAYSIAPLASYWGDLTCDAVKGSTCARYTASRKVASGTSRRELGVLQAALNYAFSEGLLIHPLKVTLPPAGEPRDRWLTRTQVAALLWNAAPHVRRFILLSIYTGRRASAVLSLTWTRFDLEAGVIRFKEDGTVETNKRRGRVRARKLLLHAKHWKDGATHVVHFDGQPIRSIKNGLQAAARRAGIGKVTPHMLKHTSITWAIMNGLSVEDAAEYFDTSPETIRKHYWHHSPHHQARALDVVERRG